MKPTPLRNKKQSYICPLTGKFGWYFFPEEVVKAAVEWFRDERKELIQLLQTKKITPRQFIVKERDKLKEAFEDVTK